jgi:hypothetical protein
MFSPHAIRHEARALKIPDRLLQGLENIMSIAYSNKFLLQENDGAFTFEAKERVLRVRLG